MQPIRKTNSLTLCASVALMLGALTGCNTAEQPATRYVHVGPNWAALNALPDSANKFQLKIAGPTQYKVGNNIHLEVTSEKSGKLWAVYVDPDDKLSLLLPNDLDTQQAIQAGQARQLPGQNWDLKATEPTGESVVAFIVTTGDTDLMDVLGQQASAGKALDIVKKDPQWAVAKMVITVSK